MEQPVKGLLATITKEEFNEFVWRLGWFAFNSVATASMARHKWPLNSTIDYLDIYMDHDSRVEVLAKAYWKDLVSAKLCTEELSEKWFSKTSFDLAREVSEMLSRVRRSMPPFAPK